MGRLRPARGFSVEVVTEPGRGKPIRKKTCSVCGKQFRPTSGKQKACRKECQEDLRRDTLRRYRLSKPPTGGQAGRRGYAERRCEGCSRAFRPTTGNQRYCRGEGCPPEA